MELTRDAHLRIMWSVSIAIRPNNVIQPISLEKSKLASDVIRHFDVLRKKERKKNQENALHR